MTWTQYLAELKVTGKVLCWEKNIYLYILNPPKFITLKGILLTLLLIKINRF